MTPSERVRLELRQVLAEHPNAGLILQLAEALRDEETATLRAEAARLRAACEEFSAALSQIDYLACHEDNDMGVSTFDLHCDPAVVVEHVKAAVEAAQR